VLVKGRNAVSLETEIIANPPLCPLLYDFSISILRKLFITDTSVTSSGNITVVVVIDILTTAEFINVSLATINEDRVNNIQWQAIPQVNNSLSERVFLNIISTIMLN